MLMLSAIIGQVTQQLLTAYRAVMADDTSEVIKWTVTTRLRFYNMINRLQSQTSVDNHCMSIRNIPILHCVAPLTLAK